MRKSVWNDVAKPHHVISRRFKRASTVSGEQFNASEVLHVSLIEGDSSLYQSKEPDRVQVFTRLMESECSALGFHAGVIEIFKDNVARLSAKRQRSMSPNALIYAAKVS